MYKVAFGISALVNIVLVVFIYELNRTQPPPFEPFHVRNDFKDSDLIADGYTQVPVDVYMLGKTIGNLTMHYGLEEDSGKPYWRQAIIDTKMKVIDTLGIYELIESYEGDILLPEEITYNKTRYVPPLTSTFFVKHRISNQIFECYFQEDYDTSRQFTGYNIMVDYGYPLIDTAAINLTRLVRNSRRRFGPDTTIFEDGGMKIQNYWNWTMEGEDIWLRPNGSLETLRIYKDGELQNTKSYYENGVLGSDVISYNLTGCSTWWYPNGELMEEVEYKNGRRHGRHTVYYGNGNVEMSGKYSGGFYDRGIKDGEWTYYDSLGRVKKREWFRQDTLLRTVRY